jgi:hypothetical protein
MAAARIFTESAMSGNQAATLWILECPHGRVTFLQEAGGDPGTEGTIARRELLPAHDDVHGDQCTRRLWSYYMGLTTSPD